MNGAIGNRDNKGRFLKIPLGQKFNKILKEEKRLGVLFEDDYKEKYLHDGGMGQKRFSERWRASRSWIFSNHNGRTSWIDQLGLPKKNNSVDVLFHKFTSACEFPDCNYDRSMKCHWIDKAHGGPNKPWNIINACPNHHDQLDNIAKNNELKGLPLSADDLKILDQAKQILNEHVDSSDDDEEIKEIYRRRIDRRCF